MQWPHRKEQEERLLESDVTAGSRSGGGGGVKGRRAGEALNWHESNGAWGGGGLPESIWKTDEGETKDFYIFC